MGPRYQYESLASTQSHAIAKARAGAPPMTRVVARTQWEGRGRMFHRWASPAGGLYLSVIAEEPPRRLSLFPLALGTEIAADLSERFGVRPVVKWPNDLLIVAAGRPARKLGGILIDRVTPDAGPVRLVVGVGINVQVDRTELPPDVRDRAVSLAELTTPVPTVETIEELVVGAIARTGAQLRSDAGAERALKRCQESLYGVGRRVRVDGTPVGVLTGLAEDGAIRVESGGAAIVVRAGDLLVEEAA